MFQMSWSIRTSNWNHRNEFQRSFQMNCDNCVDLIRFLADKLKLNNLHFQARVNAHDIYSFIKSKDINANQLNPMEESNRYLRSTLKMVFISSTIWVIMRMPRRCHADFAHSNEATISQAKASNLHLEKCFVVRDCIKKNVFMPTNTRTAHTFHVNTTESILKIITIVD